MTVTHNLLKVVFYSCRRTIRIVVREVREAVGRPFYPLGIKQLIAPARIVRRCLPEGEAVTLEERDERSPEIVRFVLCFAPGLSLISPVRQRLRHRGNGHDEQYQVLTKLGRVSRSLRSSRSRSQRTGWRVGSPRIQCPTI